MAVVCRPARMDDLKRADEIVVASINELTERRGFGKLASSQPPNFQAFSLRNDTDAHAEMRGASIKALITFTFNNVSQGLYIRHGLFPRFPIYMVTVPRDRLASRLAKPRLHLEPLTDKTTRFDELTLIDVSTLGVSREKHHRFLLGESATSGFTIRADGECVGYVYISDGHIGPLAVRRPDLVGPAFATALSFAARSNSPTISAFVPGASEPALKAATGHGMHITFPMLLMSTRQFGDWVSYLPRNPGFM